MNKDELIIATALKLFVDNGFHGTATSRIATEAGVANGTLFNYFPTKEILIVSIYNSVIQKMDDYIIAGITSHSVSKESFRALFIATLHWNLQNSIEFRYIQQYNNSPYPKSAVSKTFSLEEHPLYVLIKNGIDLVLLKPMPIGFLFSLFTAQVNGLYYYLVSHNLNQAESSDLIDETFEMLWKMIKD